jgi:hypothetical protein
MPATKRRLPDLERDTPLVALAAARAVLEERSAGLASPLPDTLARQLARRAKLHYRNNPVFRRRLNAPGDRGRDSLYAFMHHWLDGEFAYAPPATRSRV